MATQRKNEPDFDEEIEEIQEFARDSAELQEEKSLDGMLAELRGANNVSVNVYRTGKGRHLAFLFNCAPTDYTLGQLQEKLRDEYGGGEFRVHIREAGQLVANQLIAVEAPKTAAVPTAPVASSNNDMAGFLMAMQENTRTMMMALQDSATRQSENMVAMMTTLFSSLANREPPQQNTLADMLGLLATSKNLFDSGKKDISDIELIKMGIDLAKENGGGDENPITALVKSMGPAVVSLAEQAKAAQTQQRFIPPTPRTAAPAPAPVPQNANTNLPVQQAAPTPAPIESAPASQENAPMTREPLHIPPDYQEFAHFLPILLQAAQIDADTELYANMLVDQIPREKLLNLLGDKNKFMLVLSTLPGEFAPFTEWLEETRDIAVELLQEEDDDVHESDPDDPDGDAENGHVIPAEDISDPDDEPPATA